MPFQPSSNYYPGFYSHGYVYPPVGYFPYSRGYSAPQKLDLTDEEVKEAVEDTLEDDPQLRQRDVDAIKVSVDGGIVTLKGKVRSRQAKWQAYTDAYWSGGVVDVLNELEIARRNGKSDNR